MLFKSRALLASTKLKSLFSTTTTAMLQISNRVNGLDAHLMHPAPPKPARGLTPPALEGSVHALRCLEQLRCKDKSIEKYIYLTQLKQHDEEMFYYICTRNMSVRNLFSSQSAGLMSFTS